MRHNRRGKVLSVKKSQVDAQFGSLKIKFLKCVEKDSVAGSALQIIYKIKKILAAPFILSALMHLKTKDLDSKKKLNKRWQKFSPLVTGYRENRRLNGD